MLALALAVARSAEAAEAFPHFVETQVFRFHAAVGMGSGVSAADYDNDGDIDLFLPTAAQFANRLLQNVGDGTFVEVQDEVGLHTTASARAGLWVDFDGDGQLDLLTAGDAWLSPNGAVIGKALRLYRQREGRFEDVTDASGIDSTWITESRAHLGGLCASDVNNDGYVDILVSMWGGEGNRLFLNNHDGTFAEIAQLSALQSPGNYWQPVMCDFDQDGWTDIYSAVDFAPNALWINQRDLKFVDRAFSAAADNHMNDMGTALGDYDNDGDFDLFVTNIERAATHSVLLRNDTAGAGVRFTETAHASGLLHSGWAWGCTFFDADNDGWLDLAVTNGWPDRDEYGIDQSRLYRNRDGAFTDVSDETNFADSLWGSALVAADLDGDGDRDLIQTCIGDDATSSRLRILESRLELEQRRQHLTVRPRMTGGNRFAVGSVVRVRLDSGTTLSRRISIGCSFLGQEPFEATFGTGNAEVVAVTIAWPDGSHTELGPQAKGGTITALNRNPDRFVSIKRDPRDTVLDVTWHGGVLQQASGGIDSPNWTSVPAVSNPYPVTPQAPAMFFRVAPE